MILPIGSAISWNRKVTAQAQRWADEFETDDERILFQDDPAGLEVLTGNKEAALFRRFRNLNNENILTIYNFVI